MKATPTTGHVYFIDGFTAPKVFNGLYFECLITDQKISAHIRIKKDLGHLLDWRHEIYKPERFGIVERKIKTNATTKYRLLQ